MMAVESDPARRVLRIRFVGFVSAAHLQARAGEFVDLLATLGPGFTLVTDLTDLEEMELDTVTELTRLMDRCLNGGVGRIVRVIPDPDKDIGFHILSMTHYRGRVPIGTFQTREEADRTLNPPAE